MLNAGIFDLFFFLCRLLVALAMVGGIAYLVYYAAVMLYAFGDTRKAPPLPTSMDNPDAPQAWKLPKPWNQRA